SSENDVELDRETVDTPINNQYDSRYDLCESIPGLYRLLDLCKDKGSNESVLLHDFEVKKSQEQKENFELYKGFDLSLLMPSLQSSYAAECSNKLPLYPLVVESVSNQKLLTRRIKTATITTEKNKKLTCDSLPRFQEFFTKRLEAQKYALFIDRSYMTIQELQVLVEGGMNIKDLFLQYNIDLKKLEDEKVESTNKAIKDIQLDMEININQTESSANISAPKIFYDEENNFHELIKKYTAKAKTNGWTFFGLFKWLNNSTSEVMKKINDDAKKIPDTEFVKQIFDLKDDNIASSFLKVYEEWRKQGFVQTLNTFVTDEEQNDIHLQYRNIQIKQWYLEIPKIAHLFFIKNTEDVCFVEENGEARIYSLINDNFRAGSAKLPANCTRVMSTPDGTCFVAFVKEKLAIDVSEVKNKVIEIIPKNKCSEMTNSEIELLNTNETNASEGKNQLIKTIPENTCSEMRTDNETTKSSSIDNITKNKEFEIINQGSIDDSIETDLHQDTTQALNREVVRGYVFFLEKFSKDANKVIEVPFTNPNIELFQFTSLADKQVHLVTIDLYNNILQSLMVKITHAKTKFRFERKTKEKALGKVKIESYDPFTVIGQNTKFTKDLQIGDFLVIGNEKRQIIKVINDSELKITNKQLFKSLNFGEWQRFQIEPKANINGLLDVYSMVFTKYAITNPFGQIDKPLKLTIVMDLRDEFDIDSYNSKFQTYIRKLFRKFKNETKKPMGHLEKFTTNCISFESFDNLTDEYTEYKLGK
ncbi:10245_t:CDS:2, partial [Racocetra fulgida]